MLEFYPQVRAVHLAAVTLSCAWFALRVLALALGRRWPRWMIARALGWTIDGTLLTAATMLWTMLPATLFANGWLTAKLGFVATYLGMSWWALQPGHSRRRMLLPGAIAALAWLCAYGIARAHDPRGWLA